MREDIGNFNDVRGIMVFMVMTMDDQFEVELDVSCGEDIESYMKMYLNEKWDELFGMESYVRDVCDASFLGIKMLAIDKENKHSCYIETINGGRRRASVHIDQEILKDNNIDKLNRIKEIINS